MLYHLFSGPSAVSQLHGHRPDGGRLVLPEDEELPGGELGGNQLTAGGLREPEACPADTPVVRGGLGRDTELRRRWSVDWRLRETLHDHRCVAGRDEVPQPGAAAAGGRGGGRGAWSGSSPLCR